VLNVIPATGGTDAEPPEEIRQSAPQAFRVQERAVTEADYGEVAARHPGVQRAVASRRFTGSWYTMFVTVDRLVALEDHCDAAERAVLEHLIRASGDFRELHLVSTIAGHLDTAFDALVRSGLVVRDYVLGIAPRS